MSVRGDTGQREHTDHGWRLRCRSTVLLKAGAPATDTEGRRTCNTPTTAGSARFMAHAVVITQVYLDEHGHGVVTCRQCGVTGPLTLAESWEASRGHTYPMTCRACHHICQVYFVRRRHHRQPVLLPGLLYALHTHQPLDTITITSLSTGGISFQTSHQIGCRVGERYAIVFGRATKDSAVVSAAIVIIRLQGQVVGAAFTPASS